MFDFDWDSYYQGDAAPWETKHPSTELQRVIAEEKLQPCRTIELGCGTGINAVWLAQQGFEVTAVDISPRAIEKARGRAAAAGAKIRFAVADVLDLKEVSDTYAFFFDRGCYHVVREFDVQAYLRTLRQLTVPGSLGLVLTGNARETYEDGPPVVTEEELRAELPPVFEIIQLREFYFDRLEESGIRYPAWSCLVRRTGESL
jgi:SAM-dependent methyltransferase